MADNAFKSRRENGRLAQRRYRERQVRKIRDLEEQVFSLRKALSARAEDLQSPSQSHSKDTVPKERRALEFESSSASRRSLTNSEWKEIDHELSASLLELQLHESSLNPTGRFSPRLTYGIMGMGDPNRTMQFNNPPPDIVHYLQETTTTLAKALFWRAMETALRTGLELQRQFQQERQVHQHVQRHILALPFLVDGIDIVLKRIEFRLLFFQQGTVEIDHPGRDPTGAIQLHRRILMRMEQQKVSQDGYLNAQEAEAFLLHQLGALMPTSFAPSMTSSNRVPSSSAMDSLVNLLAMRTVCLGDGPRWRHQTLIEAIQETVS